MPNIFSFSLEQITSVIAVILSISAILYSYKGIKVTKYIETITNQRIQWIDSLRKDLSQILTFANLYKQFLRDAEATTWWIESDEYFQQEPEEMAESDAEIIIRKDKKKKIIAEVKKSENINIIELVILRLNDIDDSILLERLEKLKNAFLENKNEIITDGFIIELRKEIKILLKSEWERVKLEVRKGGNINAWKNRPKKTVFWK